MSKAKFEAAKKFIQEKQYDKARIVLRTIDHPQAKEWLKRINDLEKGKNPDFSDKPKVKKPATQSQAVTPPVQNNSKLLWIVSGILIFAVLAVGALFLLNPNDETPILLTESAPAVEITVEITPEPTQVVSIEEMTTQTEQIFATLSGVMGTSGFSLLAGGNSDFDYLVSVSLTVDANNQQTADRIVSALRQSLQTEQVDLQVTLDDGVSTPMVYRWASAQQAWTTTRAYTSKALADAFRAVEGVDYAGSIGISNGVAGAYDVAVHADVNVLGGFGNAQMAENLLQQIFTTYETQAVEFQLTLLEGTVQTTYHWMDGVWQ